MRSKSGDITPEKIKLYMQNPAISCICGRKMVRCAIHNACSNPLTMETAFPRLKSLEIIPDRVSTLRVRMFMVLCCYRISLYLMSVRFMILFYFYFMYFVYDCNF